MNNMSKFQDLLRIFMRLRNYTDRHTECINIFQLCWKMLKSAQTRSNNDEQNPCESFEFGGGFVLKKSSFFLISWNNQTWRLTCRFLSKMSLINRTLIAAFF